MPFFNGRSKCAQRCSCEISDGSEPYVSRVTPPRGESRCPLVPEPNERRPVPDRPCHGTDSGCRAGLACGAWVHLAAQDNGVPAVSKSIGGAAYRICQRMPLSLPAQRSCAATFSVRQAPRLQRYGRNMLRAPIVAVALCVAGLWSVPADACSCAVPGLPCEAAWRSDVVFSGRVVSLDSPAPGTGIRGVQFAVIASFRGPQLRTIVVGSGGGCSYSFKVGESYLVYARHMQGMLTTSICTRTRPLRDAADDLAYAQTLSGATPGAPARVVGTVQVWDPPILVNGDPRPMAGTRRPKPIPHVMVTANGEGGVFSARTNERGEFELNGLPPGKYEIGPEAPVGYRSVPREVELFDPRGCGRIDLFVKYERPRTR